MKYLFFAIPAIAISTLIYIGCTSIRTKTASIPAHEYQLDISDSGYFFYDGAREVGFVPFGQAKYVDSLMLMDNL